MAGPSPRSREPSPCMANPNEDPGSPPPAASSPGRHRSVGQSSQESERRRRRSTGIDEAANMRSPENKRARTESLIPQISAQEGPIIATSSDHRGGLMGPLEQQNTELANIEEEDLYSLGRLAFDNPVHHSIDSLYQQDTCVQRHDVAELQASEDHIDNTIDFDPISVMLGNHGQRPPTPPVCSDEYIDSFYNHDAIDEGSGLAPHLPLQQIPAASDPPLQLEVHAKRSGFGPSHSPPQHNIEPTNPPHGPSQRNIGPINHPDTRPRQQNIRPANPPHGPCQWNIGPVNHPNSGEGQQNTGPSTYPSHEDPRRHYAGPMNPPIGAHKHNTIGPVNRPSGPRKHARGSDGASSFSSSRGRIAGSKHVAERNEGGPMQIGRPGFPPAIAAPRPPFRPRLVFPRQPRHPPGQHPHQHSHQPLLPLPNRPPPRIPYPPPPPQIPYRPPPAQHPRQQPSVHYQNQRQPPQQSHLPPAAAQHAHQLLPPLQSYIAPPQRPRQQLPLQYSNQQLPPQQSFWAPSAQHPPQHSYLPPHQQAALQNPNQPVLQDPRQHVPQVALAQHLLQNPTQEIQKYFKPQPPQFQAPQEPGDNPTPIDLAKELLLAMKNLVHQKQQQQQFQSPPEPESNTSRTHDAGRHEQKQQEEASAANSQVNRSFLTTSSELRRKVLEQRDESAIFKLHGNLPKVCSTCGLRFRCTEDLNSHMDWHFQDNRSSKHGSGGGGAAAAQGPSGVWFVRASKRVEPGLKPNAGTGLSVGDRGIEEVIHAPQNTEECTVCNLCSGEMELIYDDDVDDWILKDAMYLRSTDASGHILQTIVHRSCNSHVIST